MDLADGKARSLVRKNLKSLGGHSTMILVYRSIVRFRYDFG